VTDASGVVTIDNSSAAAIASFDVSGSYTAANFALGKDGTGHLLLSYVDPPTPALAANAASDDELGGGGLAQLLGSYGADFAGPSWTPAAAALGFDTLAALASSAGTGLGGVGFHHENDGNVGRPPRRHN